MPILPERLEIASFGTIWPALSNAFNVNMKLLDGLAEKGSDIYPKDAIIFYNRFALRDQNQASCQEAFVIKPVTQQSVHASCRVLSTRNGTKDKLKSGTEIITVIAFF